MGDMTPPDPRQVPQALSAPAMEAGQPPDLTCEGARFTGLDAKVRYAIFRRDDLDLSAPDALTAALNDMAAHGWRLVTFDGERYIFERPARDNDNPRERGVISWR